MSLRWEEFKYRIKLVLGTVLLYSIILALLSFFSGCTFKQLDNEGKIYMRDGIKIMEW